jgi:hypothetical protein
MMTKNNKIISIVEIDPKKEAAKIRKKGAVPIHGESANHNYLDVDHLVSKERKDSSLSHHTGPSK